MNSLTRIIAGSAATLGVGLATLRWRRRHDSPRGHSKVPPADTDDTTTIDADPAPDPPPPVPFITGIEELDGREFLLQGRVVAVTGGADPGDVARITMGLLDRFERHGTSTTSTILTCGLLPVPSVPDTVLAVVIDDSTHLSWPMLAAQLQALYIAASLNRQLVIVACPEHYADELDLDELCLSEPLTGYELGGLHGLRRLLADPVDVAIELAERGPSVFRFATLYRCGGSESFTISGLDEAT